jgi:hypothetical protein
VCGTAFAHRDMSGLVSGPQHPWAAAAPLARKRQASRA